MITGLLRSRPAARPLPGRIVRRIRRDTPLALLDLGLALAAYTVALALRFDAAVPTEYWIKFRALVPVVAATHLLVNHLFGLYGQMWRYASVREARRVVFAGTTSGLLVCAAALASGHPRPLPLSVVVMGSVLAAFGFGAVRFQSRLFAFRQRNLVKEPARVLLMGAGEAGQMILKDILRSPSLGLQPVAVVDDDGRKVGRLLHGVPILGGRAAIPSLAKRLNVDQVLLAVPSATGELIREVAILCEGAHVPLQVLPAVREIIGGRVSVRDIRDLRIEDLLSRQQVKTDLEEVGTILRDKRVLITGAGGSIGSEIVRQVLSFEPSVVVVLDHDETHLHDLMVDIEFSDRLVPALADVRESDRMLALFMKYRPHVVFHAAAHKHVPLLEDHPEEALRTNLLGTANVVDAAVATGVKRFVLISTDKAINPTSVMGASKWLAEEMVRSVEADGSNFCAVRFGNVLGSRGSVIPTFLKQIERGGPVTVTDSGMIRYFMSTEEAVQLVLQAAAVSDGGEVFTLEMGEPVNILDLARKLVRLSGRIPDRDVEIRIVGVRPGEKLAEELTHPSEEALPSVHAGIAVSRPPLPDRAALKRALWELEALAAEGRPEEMAARMKGLAAGELEEAKVLVLQA